MEKDISRVRNLYHTYLKDKRVALVGPAACMSGSQQGKLIDSFDVVIRLKKALNILDDQHSVDLGTRCDVLYHSMNFNSVCGGWLDFEAVSKHQVKFLIGGYPPQKFVQDTPFKYREHIDQMYQKCQQASFSNLTYLEPQWFLKQCQRIGAVPNTGTIAILDLLLNHQVSELYITGITFFKGGYLKDYQPCYTEQGIKKFIQEVGLHRTEQELQYVLSLIKGNCRVTWREMGMVTSSGQFLRMKNTARYRKKLKKIRAGRTDRADRAGRTGRAGRAGRTAEKQRRIAVDKNEKDC